MLGPALNSMQPDTGRCHWLFGMFSLRRSPLRSYRELIGACIGCLHLLLPDIDLLLTTDDTCTYLQELHDEDHSSTNLMLAVEMGCNALLRRCSQLVNDELLPCPAGTSTCFQHVYSTTLGDAQTKDRSSWPEEFQQAPFCENYEIRSDACSRTWLRGHAQDNLMCVTHMRLHAPPPPPTPHQTCMVCMQGFSDNLHHAVCAACA